MSLPPLSRGARRAPLVVLLLLAAACGEQDPTAPRPGASGVQPRSAVEAQAFDGRIRIGVVPTATSVTLGSQAAYTITNKQTGAVLLGGTNGTATVTLASVVLSWYRLQVMCGSTTAVATRKAAAETAGHPTFTEFVAAANCTRLFIGRFAPPPANTFAARTAYKNQLIAEGLAAADAFWGVKADPGVTAYRVTQGATTVDVTSPVVLSSSDDLVSIDGARYRGVAEVVANGAGSLAGVNELPMEQYLYGVVPRELGPIQYPELEALKAQAVAARTYALAGLGKRSSDGYDLLATTTDQVYGGYEAEHPLSTQAVDATAGIAATFDGRLIQALYSSTSGGHTADSEESFATVIPYLRGVPDAERGEAFERVPSLELFRSAAAPAALRGLRSGDFDADWGRFHRWTAEWTMPQITEVISAYAGRPVGAVLAINVLERGPSGRVLRIEYVTEAGTFTDTKDRIRSSLRFFNASSTPTNLLSTLFYIEPVQNPGTGAPSGYRAFGGGFGHGVGLSQTGAVGMAERGRTYDEILTHYYQGITLEQWY